MYPVGYHEGYAYVAQLALIVAGIAPITLMADRRPLLYGLLFSTIGLGVFAMFYDLYSLYVDGILSLFFSGSLAGYLALRDKSYKRALIVLPVMALLLLKPVGIFFASACILIFLGFELYALVKSRRDGTDWLRNIAVILILIFLPLACQLGWTHYRHTLPPKQTFARPDYISIASNVATSDLTPVQHKIVANYNAALLKRAVGWSSHPLQLIGFNKVPLTATLLLAVLCALFLFYQTTEMDKRLRHEHIYINILLCLTCSLYLSGMLLQYLGSFSEYEALRTASYPRYAGVFLMAWLFIEISYIFRVTLHYDPVGVLLTVLKRTATIDRKKASRTTVLLTVLAVICVFSSTELLASIDDKVKDPRLNTVIEIKLLADAVKPKMQVGKKVFLLWQYSHGYEKFVFRFYMIPQNDAGGASLGEPSGPDDLWTVVNASLPTTLDGYEYLVIGHSSDSFWKLYAQYFDASVVPELMDKPDRRAIFHIDRNNQAPMKLSLIAYLPSSD